MNLLRRKSVAAVLAQNADDGGEPIPGGGKLQKKLTAWDLIGFGIGMVIGTGIFTLTGLQAKINAGPAVMLSFAIAGGISLLAAMCYAELAAAVPTAGSAYTYAYTTLGEIFAWIIAWDLILEFALGSAVVARGWSGYLAGVLPFLPDSLFGEGSVVNLGAIIIVGILGFVALRGIKESAWVTNAFVVIKVSVCVFVIVVGIFFVRVSNWIPFIPPVERLAPEELVSSVERRQATLTAPLWQVLTGVTPAHFGVVGVFVAAAIVFFSYSGFEVMANMGEETKNPKRDMPLALLGTLGICTLLYVGVCMVVTGMVKYTDLSEGDAVAQVFRDVGLGWAGILIGLAAIAGLSSVILVDLVAMGRIGFALSRDGLLPAAFSQVHPRWNTPVLMTSLTIGAVMVLSALFPISILAEMVSIGTLFAFLVVSIAVPVLRRTNPDMKRSFKVPFSPVLPIVSALSCVALMANLSLETWLRFGVWLILGLIIYFSWGQRHSKLAGDQSEAATGTEDAAAEHPRDRSPVSVG